jgi:hypothetical protein
MDLSKTLLDLEQSLLSRAVRSDAKELSQLIADDFVEIGARGVKWSKAEVIEQLPKQSFTQRTISQFSSSYLSGDIALVTYHCQNMDMARGVTVNTLRSSIWRKQGEQWHMVFHQGTILLE